MPLSSSEWTVSIEGRKDWRAQIAAQVVFQLDLIEIFVPLQVKITFKNY